ncbi:hypothetical protein ABPG74_022740 [Tetrahymena malaccensis]
MMKFKKFDEEDNIDDDGSSTQDSQNDQEIKLKQKIIDVDNDFYPFCIVWSAIPFISFLIPWIGHAAICCSKGIIHDFNKDFKVYIDVVPYGSPLKYYKLDTTNIQQDTYDAMIKQLDQLFLKKRFGFFSNNSHKYVADALNILQYKGKINWNKFDIFILGITKAKYTSFLTLIRAYQGLIFTIVCALFINVTIFRTI